jgi:hypothetical protein
VRFTKEKLLCSEAYDVLSETEKKRVSAAKKHSRESSVSKHPNYALKVEIEGPGVHKKSIAIPDLIHICEAIQSAVHRQAEVMERPTAKPSDVDQLPQARNRNAH